MARLFVLNPLSGAFGALLFLLGPGPALSAQVPNLISQQGRVAVNGVNFDGTGQFKFALVNAAGSVTYWSNDGTSTAGSQPAAAVSLPVTKGLYSVQLGDVSLTNMTAVPAAVFANADVRVRVWFNNGVLGFQQLAPDQRLSVNGYLPDGAVSSAKLAPGAAPPPVIVTGTSQAAAANTSYLAIGNEPASFALPLTANIGDAVHIGSAGGAWTATTYDANAWTPRAPSNPWFSIASSADGTKLAAGTDGGKIYTSTDAGVTWTARPVPNAWWYSLASSADGSRLVAAAYNQGIFTSADSGATWTSRLGVLPWWGVSSSADGMKMAAAPFGGNLWVSTDGGVNWIPRAPHANWTSVAGSSDGTKLVATANLNGIYASTDSGTTWNYLAGSAPESWYAVTSSADGAKLVAAAFSGKLYTSTNSGGAWTPRESNRPWVSVASSADGVKLIASAASGGRLYISADSGVTWTPREQSRQWWGVASSADGNRLAAADRTGRIYMDNAGGFAGGNLPIATGGVGTEGTFRYLGNGVWQGVKDSDDSVTSAQIADGAVTSGHIVAGAVTAAKLGPDVGLWSVFGANVYRTAGAVGIGTNNPRHLLSLGQSINSTKLALFDSGPYVYGFGVSSGQFRLHIDQPLSRFSFLDAPEGNELMTIAGTGQVGVGTATPQARLHVYSADNPTVLRLHSSAGPGYGRLEFFSNAQASADEWRPGYIQSSDAGNFTGGLSFVVNGTGPGNKLGAVETMRLQNGRVGIGTPDPQARLDVDTGGAGRVQIRNEDNFVPAINVTGGPPGYLRFRHSLEIWPNDAGTSAGRMDIRNAAGAATIYLEGGSGSIGAGRFPAANRLEVEGDASKTTAGAWLANSDRRIKTDIQPVTGALETIEKVKPVTFRYTDEYRKAHPGIKDVPYYNVIAQEFRQVFPNAVKSSGEKQPDGSEILQVDTYPATITALAAIKELKAENEVLKQRLAALEDLVHKMSAAGTAAPGSNISPSAAP